MEWQRLLSSQLTWPRYRRALLLARSSYKSRGTCRSACSWHSPGVHRSLTWCPYRIQLGHFSRSWLCSQEIGHKIWAPQIKSKLAQITLKFAGKVNHRWKKCFWEQTYDLELTFWHCCLPASNTQMSYFLTSSPLPVFKNWVRPYRSAKVTYHWVKSFVWQHADHFWDTIREGNSTLDVLLRFVCFKNCYIDNLNGQHGARHFIGKRGALAHFFQAVSGELWGHLLDTWHFCTIFLRLNFDVLREATLGS